MKKLFSLSLLFFLINKNIAQSLSINTTGANADASAILDVSGNTKGMLIPRMTDTEMRNINAAAFGLLVINTTDSAMYIKHDTGWVKFNMSLPNATANYWSFNNNNITNTNNGNVGIGTALPLQKIDINGASLLANSSIINPDLYGNRIVAGRIADGSGFDVLSGIGGNAATNPQFQGRSWAVGHNGSNLYIASGTGFSSTLQTGIQINTNRNVILVPVSGNVGIGVASPTSTLSVARGVGVDATATFSGINQASYFNFGPNQQTYIRGGFVNSQVIINDGGGYTAIGTSLVSAGSALTIQAASGNAEILTLRKPSVRTWGLGIDNIGGGNFEFYDHQSLSYLVASVSTNSGTYWNASDSSIKKNISKISNENGLSKILQLNPVSYLFKSQPDSDNLSYGFLAQEVAKIFPEFVEQKTKVKMISYTQFIPVIIKGMQQQQQQIELLKTQNNELLKRLIALENKK